MANTAPNIDPAQQAVAPIEKVEAEFFQDDHGIDVGASNKAAEAVSSTAEAQRAALEEAFFANEDGTAPPPKEIKIEPSPPSPSTQPTEPSKLSVFKNTFLRGLSSVVSDAKGAIGKISAGVQNAASTAGASVKSATNKATTAASNVKMPAMPTMPKLPSISMPAMPKLPTMPSLPKLSIPTPSVPTMSDETKGKIKSGLKTAGTGLGLAATVAITGAVGYGIAEKVRDQGTDTEVTAKETPETESAPTVKASEIKNISDLAYGTIVTFSSYEEATNGGYITLKPNGKHITEPHFTWASDLSKPLDPKNPDTFKLRKINDLIYK